MAVSCDDNILEESLHDELGRCLVVLRVADSIDEDCEVANRNAGRNLDQICSTGNSPGTILKCTISNSISYPCSFVEISWEELEGEGDGDLSIGADSGISSKEQRVSGDYILGGLHG